MLRLGVINRIKPFALLQGHSYTVVVTSRIDKNVYKLL